MCAYQGVTNCKLTALTSLSLRSRPRCSPSLPSGTDFFADLLKRAPNLTRLSLRVPIRPTELLTVLPSIEHCLVCLDTPDITGDDQLMSELFEGLQSCPRLTQLFPPGPLDASNASDALMRRSWLPLVLSLGTRLEHLSVPWLLYGQPQQWAALFNVEVRGVQL